MASNHRVMSPLEGTFYVGVIKVLCFKVARAQR